MSLFPDEQDLSSYIRAADFLNISNVDVVCLQHEFGIFGGRAGGHILALLRELRMPVVTTLHTVLREPMADQRRVMQELISLSTRLVIMAERGRQMLQEIYHAPPAKIDLIPHGIPDIGFVDPTYFKDQFGVEGRVVLLTFGLLSPNKGIEYVLNALPRILAEFPDVVYIVLGNCGSPIETDAGWLVLSHGVGPMRKYCIGAFLLDRDDPAKVIGRLREPLLKPNQSEREGYVPNVVYTCGALLHNGELIIPYGLADHATGFATVPLNEVLAAMQ